MNNKTLFPIALVWALFCGALSVPTLAQDVYISDELYVPLRSGMGTKFRIVHRGLPSGTKMTLIEENAEAGWSLVETAKGDQGWIRNQYISKEPIAKLKLRVAEQQMLKLTQERNQLRNQKGELEQLNSHLKRQLSDSDSASQKLGEELAHIKQISAGSLDLHAQYQALSKEHQLLQTQVDVLKAENERLQSDQVYHQWMFGAGILVLGVIITLISQTMGKRKRFSEWG